MHYFILFFSVLTFSYTFSAQNKVTENNTQAGVINNIDMKDLSDTIWVDYVMGKPYMAHYEAMKATAKAWGINYKVNFAGCVIDDEMQGAEAKIEQANKKYFAKLNAKFGEDWRERFNIDVKKQLPIYTTEENPTWKYTIIGRPSMLHVDAKKAVAKEWGINLEIVFLGCMPDKPGVQKERNEASQSSKAYLKAITAHYGADWETHFNKEVAAKVEAMRGK